MITVTRRLNLRKQTWGVKANNSSEHIGENDKVKIKLKKAIYCDDVKIHNDDIKSSQNDNGDQRHIDERLVYK